MSAWGGEAALRGLALAFAGGLLRGRAGRRLEHGPREARAEELRQKDAVEKQGRDETHEEHEDHEGHKVKKFAGFELVREGSMTEKEYRQAMRDLVNFLAYVGEPAKLQRQRLGVWVLLFLAVFFVVSYALKKEYWKDVH